MYSREMVNNPLDTYRFATVGSLCNLFDKKIIKYSKREVA